MSPTLTEVHQCNALNTTILDCPMCSQNCNKCSETFQQRTVCPTYCGVDFGHLGETLVHLLARGDNLEGM